MPRIFAVCVQVRTLINFPEMKLHETESKEIKAPGIAESPVNIECRVVSEQPLGSHTLFLAKVVNVQVDDCYMDEKGRFDLNASGLTAYSHGEYFELGKKLGKFGFSVNKKSDGKESKKPKKTDKAKKTSGKASKKNKNRH